MQEIENLPRLAEPTFVRGAFVLNHGRQRIHFWRSRAENPTCAGKVRQVQKESLPRFHDNKTACGAEDPRDIGERLIEIARQHWQVMKAPLNDENIAAVRL